MGAGSRFLTDEGLTFREDAFCREYFQTGCADALGAYIRAYDVTITPVSPRPKWCQGAAQKLLKSPRIIKRLEVFCKRLENVAMYTADRSMREAGEVFEKAMANGQMGAAINAVKLRAQLAGHLIEKKEVTTRSERELTHDELERMIEETAKQAGYVIAKAAAK